MATPTYDLLDSTTLTSSASSVTFSSISQDYRDLILVCEPIATASTTYGLLYLNGDTGSNYNRVTMTGDGSTTSSGSNSNAAFLDLQTAMSVGTKALIQIQIMDYSATDKHKSVLVRSGRAADRTTAIAARWANTAAVTSVEINAFSNAYDTGSTFYLFGISA